MAMKTTTIETGKVRGLVAGNQNVTVFRGIPYAGPTSGKDRFMPPKPASAWEGVRDCTEFGEICIQGVMFHGMPFSDFFLKEFYPYSWPQGENSLVLNIWTPAETPDEKLPVMFWIHGGGMSAGYGHEMEFDGEAIAKRGVILVTINYRVDVLAWFAHPELSKRSEYGMSGNLGLWDQQYALKWVRRNIAAFGGDPDNVTIFGQSAGAGSVISQTVMPGSRGLFHRAIIQSGAGGIGSVGRPPMGGGSLAPEEWGVKACELLGKTVDELQAMDAQDCFKALKDCEEKIGPCPRSVSHPVLFPNAAETYAKGLEADVPIIAGSVNGDGAMFARSYESKDAEREAILRQHLGEYYDEFLAKYPLSGEGAEIADALTAAGTIDGSVCVGYARQRSGHAPSYSYYFDGFIPGEDEFNFIGRGDAYHSIEMWYIFGVLGRCWRRFDGRHYDLSQDMTDYWTNFAKNGDPNGDGLAPWPKFEGTGSGTMVLSERRRETTCVTTEAMTKLYDFLYGKLANK